MADSITSARFIAKVDAVFTNTFGTDLTSTVSATLGMSNTLDLTDGTTASKCDKVWWDTSRALSGATSESLDLYDLGSVNIGGGAGKDVFGGAWATVEVVGLYVENESSSTGNLTLGAEGSSAAWNSLFNGDDEAAIGPIKPGGVILIYMPSDPAFAVADSSNHLLKIASSATLTYNIAILARSA